MVRNVKVSFFAHFINFYLRLIKDSRLLSPRMTYFKLVKKITKMELNEMLKSFIIKGTKWIFEKGWTLISAQGDLYHIIRTSIMLPTHVEIVNKERLVLLHCFMPNKEDYCWTLDPIGDLEACFCKKGTSIFPLYNRKFMSKE